MDPVPTAHGEHGTEHHLVLLNSVPFDRQWQATGTLPYRADLLACHGYDLVWCDPRHSPLAARLEAITVPFRQAWSTRRDRPGARAVLAMFESEGHGLALTRLVTRNRRPPLVVVACWLADLAVRSPRRRALYRRLYAAVDGVVVFSENQIGTLSRLLGIAPERIHAVRFGVDLDALANITTSEHGPVVAVGRDRARDWRTLAAAASGAGWTADLVTRPEQLSGIDLPANIRQSPPVPRDAYLRLLADAAVVVVPTDVREYPTGQSVLLEAMALGKACVVTDTPALRGYVVDGETAILVPPHDHHALRRAVDELLADGGLRARVGRQAAARERALGGARTMWDAVATVIDDVAR